MEDRCETGSRNRDVRQGKAWRGHRVRVRQRTRDEDARFTILQEEATDGPSDDNQDPWSNFPELRTTK